MAETIYPNELVLEKLNNGKFSGVMYNSEREMIKTIVKDFEWDVIQDCDETMGCCNYVTRRVGF